MKGVAASIERLDLRVRGQVQGVGFRPYVYRLARELALTGWVLNDGHGVRIQVQGARTGLARFVRQVRRGPPPLSRVEQVTMVRLGSLRESEFRIRASRCAAVTTGVTPDTATCRECLAEVLDPGNRRYRYPFTNCTQCGPRFTITAQLPYDRSRTSMAAFPLCIGCQAEYESPLDRRFHAEPNACPVCGPRLTLLDARGTGLAVSDVLSELLLRLREGRIVALKGLGGFHLVCDARNADTVRRLRAAKGREHKPLAVMVANRASAGELVQLDGPVSGLLDSPERPIVLASKREGCDEQLRGVAPGVASLGVMLPYTPLHTLLFHEAAGRPNGVGWLARAQPLVLVMTSANPGGEPLVIGNDEALQRLSGIADAFVVHDRGILQRCDDSVVNVRGPAAVMVRRARGHAPRAVALPRRGPPVLAVGGWLKNTVCIGRGAQAFVSPHVGDLSNRVAVSAMEQAVSHLAQLLQVQPELVVRDLHPDYPSSVFAERYAFERGLPVVAVQHHHAHVAAVAGEHGLTRPVLGLALDGAGLGSDGTVWGGELLHCEAGSHRLGHLSQLALPGGDAAAREPWRMAASALHRLGRGPEILRRWPGEAGSVVQQMLERQLNCPITSSAGRLFDAAAGLLGVRCTSHYEAQAAMELEALALAHGPVAAMAGGYAIRDGVLDLLPLLDQLADLDDPGHGAARFHATFAAALAHWCLDAAHARDVRDVVLAGGCMLNGQLVGPLRAALERGGLRVYEATALPPGDGGLSYGQICAALAAREGG